MSKITILTTYLALLLAGLIGVTLSVPLQAPAVIFLGVAAFCAGVSLLFKSAIASNLQWLLLFAILAISYFSVRATLSPVRDLGVQDLMLILPASILYLVAGFCFSGSSGARFRQGLTWIVILMLLLHTGAGLMQLLGSDGYSLSLYFTSSVAASENRIIGMYGYYGSFANFMTMAGLLCLSLGGWGRFNKVVRLLLFFLGCLALVLVVLSQSRSAVMSLALSLIVLVALLFLSLRHQKQDVKKSGYIIMSVLTAVALLGSLFGGIWVFKNRAQGDLEKLSEIVFDDGVRMPFWAMATEQWADYPLLGAGSRSYSYLSNKYWNPNLPTDQASPEFVHNEYLQLLADYGLIGFLLICSLLIWHLIIGVRRVESISRQVGDDGFKKGSNAMALAIAGVCGMVAMAVHITFDFRTHLLANLLLFVCCAVWVLPVTRAVIQGADNQELGKQRIRGEALGLVILTLGLVASGLGGWQLWGGIPLLQSQIAKEDGAWYPEGVSRDQWIPALEKSVARAPDFNRYQRLATLYQLEAMDLSGESKEVMTEMAKSAYMASIEHNAYNPIPWINLASMYALEKKYEEADEAFSNAFEMAKSRERWFRMCSRWALLRQQWGEDQWRKGNYEKAELHFLRAKDLYLQSYEYAYFYQNKKWVVEYTQLLIVYARFLDDQKRYEAAGLLFAEGREQVNWVNLQKDTKMNFYYGKHLYEYGHHIWYQRKPQEAYQLMLKSKSQLIQHEKMMEGEVEAGFSEQLVEVNKVIKFLEQTGVKSP